MATRAQMKTIALSMPEAEEKSHFGKPDFRVRNKIFAGLTEETNRAYIKARPELQQLLLASASGAFSPATGAWGRQGWTYIDLPKVDVSMLREIVTDAWRLVAPARLVAASAESEQAKPRSKRKRPSSKR